MLTLNINKKNFNEIEYNVEATAALGLTKEDVYNIWCHKIKYVDIILNSFGMFPKYRMTFTLNGYSAACPVEINSYDDMINMEIGLPYHYIGMEDEVNVARQSGLIIRCNADGPSLRTYQNEIWHY